jgi:3-deoxy-D-manno-octulosonic-acid transferase
MAILTPHDFEIRNPKVYSAAVMYFTYTFVLTIGLALVLPYYLVRFRKDFSTLSERLGNLKLPQLKGAIWVHAVSVGEVKAVERLIVGLRRQFPAKPLVVSTVTPAGQALAAQRRDIIDHTFYFPIDLPKCVRRALDRINPEMVIIAETEIWPNFLRECRSRGVRVVMINGRISDKSFSRYRLVRKWLPRVFEDYSIIGMQSQLDRQRIEELGADPQKVTVFGNLKYDAANSSRPIATPLAKFLRAWPRIWIAASTMPGEEELVLDAFAKLRAKYSDLHLIIAPRHKQRFDTVQDILRRRGFRFVRRSELRGDGDVMLFDTIGELSSVFCYGTVVFMGGSLVARGGHNILEPAWHRQPIVFGPHMENFREMARLFLEANAAVQIAKSTQLGPAVYQILSNPRRAAELGRNAQAIVRENAGATDRVLDYLQPAGARR